MKQETLFPITGLTHDGSKKGKLHAQILKKRKLLTLLLTKVELLRVELQMVRQEYDYRVGSLYLKDNQHDIEIIYYKNILALLHAGLTYDQAVKKLHAKYYAELRDIEDEKEHIRQEEIIYKKRNAATGTTDEQTLKHLWKQLISKFHPDLVQDTEEKKHHEGIMKQINRAYEERDYNRLVSLKNEVYIEKYHEATIEKLTEILVAIENHMIEQKAYYKELLGSEWYVWKVKLEKAKKQQINLFAGIERSLLNDIMKKYAILKKLKNQVHPNVE